MRRSPCHTGRERSSHVPRVGAERDKLARERAAVDADRDAARRALADRERDEGEALSAADARADDAAGRAAAAESARALAEKALADERQERAPEAANVAQAAGAATENNAPFVLESRQVIFTICRPVSEIVLFCFNRCRFGVTIRTGLCSRMGRRNWLGRMSTDSSSMLAS